MLMLLILRLMMMTVAANVVFEVAVVQLMDLLLMIQLNVVFVR